MICAVSSFYERVSVMVNKRRVKKMILAAAAVLAALVILLAAAAAVVFRREIATAASVKNAGGGLYTMNCTYDYNLDKLLETGVTTDRELVDFITGNLLRGIVDIDVDVEGYACTTFNAREEDGDFLFGRNFDYMPAPCMLVRTDPEDGYASVSMVNLEFAGYALDYLPDGPLDRVMTLAAPLIPVDGMNEKGLCIGVLELENGPTHQNTGKTGLTTTAMIRLVLDRAASIEEAVGLFRSVDMHDSAGCGYHYQITDASGASVILEYVNDEIVLHQPPRTGNTAGCQTAANYYVDKSVDDPKGFGQERCGEVLKTLNASNGVLSTDDAVKLLGRVSMDDQADPNGYVCDTLWSAVYNSTALTVTLCTNLDYAAFREFSLFEAKQAD